MYKTYVYTCMYYIYMYIWISPGMYPMYPNWFLWVFKSKTVFLLFSLICSVYPMYPNCCRVAFCRVFATSMLIFCNTIYRPVGMLSVFCGREIMGGS